MGSLYSRVMKFDTTDWRNGSYSEDNISLDLIKKEYAGWLGVKCHPAHNIWNHCVNYYEKDRKVQMARALYENQSAILDDESITMIESR